MCLLLIDFLLEFCPNTDIQFVENGQKKPQNWRHYKKSQIIFSRLWGDDKSSRRVLRLAQISHI